MRKQMRKLTLTRETLQGLTPRNLERAGGQGQTWEIFSGCGICEPTDTCNTCNTCVGCPGGTGTGTGTGGGSHEIFSCRYAC